MEVVESYDSHLTTVWKVLDGWTIIAICYRKKDAEACLEALEKVKRDEEEERRLCW